MDETIPQNQELPLNWRIGLALGTLGTYGTINARALESLPAEAQFSGYVRGSEDVTVEEDPQGGYFVDWRLARPLDEQIALDATYNTIVLLRNVGLDRQLDIRAVRSTCDTALIDQDSPLARAWSDMEDETGIALAYADAVALPATITAEDFR